MIIPKHPLPLFILLLLPIFSFAQIDDKQKSIETPIKEYNLWLKNKKIDNYLNADTLLVFPDKAVLIIQSGYGVDTLYKFWNTLLQNYQEKNQKIDKDMLDNFTFLFGLDRDFAEVHIQGKDPTKFTIKLFYNDYFLFDNKELITQKMASKNIEIRLDSIFSNKLNSVNNISNSDIEIVGERIISCLKNHFSALGSQNWIFWRRSSELKTIPRDYDEIELKVSCISNEVLATQLFEFLRINIQLRRRSENLDIMLDVKGKYSSGYSCPEFDLSRYYSMENKQEYLEMLEEYVHILGDKIENCVQKK